MSTVTANPFRAGSYLHNLVEELYGEPQEPQAEPWPEERWTVPEGVVVSCKVPEGTDPQQAIRQIAQALAGPPKSDSRLHKAKAELNGLDALRRLVETRRKTVVDTICAITGGRRVPR